MIGLAMRLAGINLAEALAMGYIETILILDAMQPPQRASGATTAGPSPRNRQAGPSIEHRPDGTIVQHIRTVDELTSFLRGDFDGHKPERPIPPMGNQA